MSAYDEMVSALVAQRVPRDKAEARARELCADAPPPPDLVRDAAILEKEEQAYILKLARAYGFKARSNSQARASKVAVGIGDLILMHRRRGLALWWETKRQVGGKLSPDQLDFEDDCRVCGWTYRSGDRFDFARYLVNLALAEEGDGPCGIIPTPTRQEARR